jgi:pimeloyl-ACP methyl ester carboxylesterase
MNEILWEGSEPDMSFLEGFNCCRLLQLWILQQWDWPARRKFGDHPLKNLKHITKSYKVIFLNTIICGVIAVTFDILSHQIPIWLLGGLLFGALIGFCLNHLLKWLNVPEKRYIRGFLILLIFEALLVYYIVIPSFGAYYTVHPTRLPILVTPSEMGINYEEVYFLTEDNIQIKGWYIPSTNGATILGVHGLNGNRTHTMPYMKILVEHGYGMLLIDLRAHGESGGDVFAAAWDSDQDVLAGLDYLKGRSDIDMERIGALGLSAGAHAVLYAAAKTEDIKALYLDGTGIGRTADVLDPLLPELRPLFFGIPMNHFHHVMIKIFSGVPPAPALKNVAPLIDPRPVLFVAAGSDAFETAIASRLTDLAGANAEYWIIPDVQHLGGIFKYPEEYANRMVHFFNKNLIKSFPDSDLQ